MKREKWMTVEGDRLRQIESLKAENASLRAQAEALKKEIAVKNEKLEYIRSAYCDDLDTAKDLADKALALPAPLNSTETEDGGGK